MPKSHTTVAHCIADGRASRQNQEESRTITIFPPYYTHSIRLTLKGEAGAELVAGLVQLLGIERATNAEGQTAVDLGVVGEGSNAEVVDLGLETVSSPDFREVVVIRTLAKEAGSSLYLAASSRPTLEPDLESQVALAPASTAGLTFW